MPLSTVPRDLEAELNRNIHLLSDAENPGVNFINILRAAFAPVDPKRVKRY